MIDNDLADVFDGEGVGGEAVDELGLLLGDVEHGPPPLLLAHAPQPRHDLLRRLLHPVPLPPLGQRLEGLPRLLLSTCHPDVPVEAVLGHEVLATAGAGELQPPVDAAPVLMQPSRRLVGFATLVAGVNTLSLVLVGLVLDQVLLGLEALVAVVAGQVVHVTHRPTIELHEEACRPCRSLNAQLGFAMTLPHVFVEVRSGRERDVTGGARYYLPRPHPGTVLEKKALGWIAAPMNHQDVGYHAGSSCEFFSTPVTLG